MIDKNTLLIDNAPTYVDGIRFLRNKYQNNKKRFVSRFIEVEKKELQMVNLENWEEICDFYENMWDKVTSFSYKEAFNIKDSTFRAKVFSVINVPEMIEHLGSIRIKTEGINLVNRVYNSVLDKFEEKEFTQIYELHEVNGSKLDLNEKVYAIKCWCTSTDEEHWLWVDSGVANHKDPLKAIASTCKVYESMLGKIKHIIRQKSQS